MEPFEGANEPLLEHTLDSIKKKFHRRIVVATDQDWALDFVRDMRVKGMPVDEALSGGGSYKEVMLDIANRMNMDDDDDFVMLSLEYPGRTYRNIRSAIQFFRKHGKAKSLLCKRPSETVVQKLFVERDEIYGEPVIEDKGQEWQEEDFGDTFEHSHFVTIHQVSELPKVNDWLWNEETIFFPIDTNIDRISSQSDLDEYEQQ